jgi:XTP/dITP diphosphohydrolase
MRHVEDELKRSGNPDKRAYFVCALALSAPGVQTQIFEGRVYGAVEFPPRGQFGFGYDPIFVPEGYRFTFAEMDPKAKHAMSHRSKAFEKFVKAVLGPK